jgi:hypothetical protein
MGKRIEYLNLKSRGMWCGDIIKLMLAITTNMRALGMLIFV